MIADPKRYKRLYLTTFGDVSEVVEKNRIEREIVIMTAAICIIEPTTPSKKSNGSISTTLINMYFQNHLAFSNFHLPHMLNLFADY